jgi:hypothetical protein
MKRCFFLLLLNLLCFCVIAQHKIKLVRLWEKQEVHLIYRGYDLFFKIKDINTTLKYLHAINPQLYDSTSHLDTTQLYSVELVEGRDMEYMNRLEPLIQKEVGAFLLYRGHAYVEGAKHKKVPVILMDTGPIEDQSGVSEVMIHFYDAKTGNEIFAGLMNIALEHMYLEL